MTWGLQPSDMQPYFTILLQTLCHCTNVNERHAVTATLGLCLCGLVLMWQ